MSLQEKLLNCQKCPRLRKVTPYPLAQVTWTSTPKVVTVGRNPGLEHSYENVTAENLQEFYNEHWLISRYGKYLISEFGAEFVEKYLLATNICKCSSPKNSVLFYPEIQNCLTYLIDQLEEISPQFILVFGSEAFSALDPYLQTSGRFYSFRSKSKVVKLLHPAYFLRKPSEKARKEEQSKILKAVKKLVQG